MKKKEEEEEAEEDKEEACVTEAENNSSDGRFTFIWITQKDERQGSDRKGRLDQS